MKWNIKGCKLGFSIVLTTMFLTACGGEGEDFWDLPGDDSDSSSSSSSSTGSSSGGNAALGAELYESNGCHGCHGTQDAPGFQSLDPSKSSYGENSQPLAEYIHDAMPQTDPTACVDDCAVNIAAFLQTWSSSSSTSSGGDNGSSSTSSGGDNGSSSTSSGGDNGSSSTSSGGDDSSSSTSSGGDNSSSSTSSGGDNSSSSSSSGGNVSNGQSLYTEKSCHTCHGAAGSLPLKDSYNGETLATFIHRTMPFTDPGACVDDCASDIAAYLQSLSSDSSSSGSTSSGSSGSTSSSGGTPASCNISGVTYGPRLLRVLKKNEFVNSIKDITGVDIKADLGQSTYDSIPADNYVSDFSNNVMTNIESGALQSYGLVVDKVVEKLAENSFQSVVNCEGLTNTACAARFIDTLGRKIYRRTLSDDEKSAINRLFSDDFTGGVAAEGIALALRATLTSPQFLYRDETGVPVSDIEQGGSSDDGNHVADGTMHYIHSPDAEPHTIPINNQLGANSVFSGNDVVTITVRGVQSPGGIWPSMKVEVKGNIIAEVTVDHDFDKTYSFHVEGESGEYVWTAIQNRPVEYESGQDLVVSSFSSSVAKEVEAPAVEADVQLDSDAYVLTQYQIASFLSFTFAGTTPDDVLLDAATNNQLQTEEQISAQVERLLDTPQARLHFGNHAAEWLKTDRILDIVKDTDIYPGFTDEVRQAMAQEVREVFNHVVLDEAEPFTSMIDGNYTFANQALAEFYNIGSVSGSGMQKVEGVTSRAGLITSGAFLGVNAHENDTGPILRAVRTRRRFLCHDVPAPPTGVSLSGDDFDQAREEARVAWEEYLSANGGKATARRKYEFQTSATLCQTCHKEMINPLGGGFEDFDAVGLPQSVDFQGLEVAFDGVLYGVETRSDGQELSFNGAKDLAHQIAGLDATRRCFIDNTFRMAMGTGTSRFDQVYDDVSLSQTEVDNYTCEMDKLDDAMQSNNMSTRALLKAIGNMDSVKYRKDVQRVLSNQN